MRGVLVHLLWDDGRGAQVGPIRSFWQKAAATKVALFRIFVLPCTQNGKEGRYAGDAPSREAALNRGRLLVIIAYTISYWEEVSM